jgi:hypothetical protein
MLLWNELWNYATTQDGHQGELNDFHLGLKEERSKRGTSALMRKGEGKICEVREPVADVRDGRTNRQIHRKINRQWVSE